VPATDSPWPGSRYGLGVNVRSTPLGLTYGHAGGFPGYRADLMYFARDGIAVAVQVNTSDRAAVERTELSALLVELARLTLEERQAAGGSRTG
jgi:hypothetical protein